MGRPRNTEKTIFRQWNVSLTEEDYNSLMECYRRSGCVSKVQFMCRIVAYEEKISSRIRVEERIIDELLDCRRLLANIASNINQIAKQANTQGYAAEESDIRDHLHRLEEEVVRINDIGGKLLKKAYKIMG